MKATSQADYLRRIDRVVARLASAIAAEQSLPTIPSLASEAHFSQFHFMRVYRALAGEPLGKTIQRLRLTRAVHLLTHTDDSVTSIASRVGFETPQAFARAFRQTLGLNPTELRQLGGDTPDSIVVALQPAERAEEPAPAIRVNVVDLEPFRVVAIRNRGAYRDLDQVYARLLAWLTNQRALDSMTGIWGVPYHDRRDTAEQDSLFDCCVATDAPLEVGPPVLSTQLGGGQYVSYHHIGSYTRLDEAHDQLLRDALPAQHLVLREAPIIHRFLNDPESTAEAEFETMIFIPVEHQRG